MHARDAPLDPSQQLPHHITSVECWNAVLAVRIFCVFCNDAGIHDVGHNVLWIIHVAHAVYVIHDSFDVLHPRVHFDVCVNLLQIVKCAVRGALGMRAAINRLVLFAPGALFAIGALGMTPIAHWNHVFDALSFHKIFLGQLQLVCGINKS